MAGRKLFSTSCDDEGNLAIELMKPTRQALERAEFICANLGKASPELSVKAGEAAANLADVLAICENLEPTEVLDEDDVIYEPADLHGVAEVVC